MGKELKDKDALFTGLYAIDDESTESEEENEIEFVLQSNRRRVASSCSLRGRVSLNSPPRQRLDRTASSPTPQLKSALEENASKLGGNIPTLPRASTFNGSTTAKSTARPSEVVRERASKVIGKRKRAELPNYQPVTQQIFRGQSFCGCLVIVTNVFEGLSI